MSGSSTQSRSLLFATVSFIALAAASPQVRAADLPQAIVARGPQASDPGRCEWWGEGGATEAVGRDVHVGKSAIDAGARRFGPEAALGFDCTFGPAPWHVSADVRYGTTRQQAKSFNARGTFLVPSGAALPGSPSALVPVNANGAGTLTHREDHAAADFAVGRDVGLGLGPGQTQLKVGLRIAEIEARTSGNGIFNVPAFAIISPPLLPKPFSFVQNSRFVGGGPRLGLDGTMPLGGGWGIDYLGGIAVLYGARSLDVNGTGAAPTAISNNMGALDAAAVFNLDAQAGLSYHFSQDLKLTAGYRFDGYWGALKTTNAAGAVANEDRFYAGPTLRLTGTTDGLFANPPRPRILGKALALKAPAPTDNVWTVWGEGAAFATNGGSVHFGDPVDAGKAHWGGEAAAGFDVRLGVTPWHVSADVRYGSAKNSGTFARNGMIAIPSNTPTFGTAPGVFNARVGATGSFTQREQHELADFAAGRDVGLGIGQMQVKAGLRIAEIASKTGGSANFVAPTLYSAGVFGHGLVGARPGAFSFEQQSRFAGGGPRVGVEGAVPLGGGWALDYLGGMAGLYGARSFGVTTGGTAAPFGFNEAGASDNTVVFNLDAQAGLSYWLMPSLKVTAGYRFDGYWGALKTLDANGNLANADRFYMGPTLRLTGRF